MSGWPDAVDDDRLRATAWSMETHTFWSYVDSETTSLHRRYARCKCDEFLTDPTCVYWAHHREDNRCLAAKTDLGRCNRDVAPGTPLCHFHLERAWAAMFLAATAEQRLRFTRLADSEARKHQENLIKVAAIAGYENALRMDAVTAAARVPERVYFFAAGHAVKIGRSLNPERRVRSLKGTKAPADVDPTTGQLLGTIPGGSRVESTMHQQFRRFRLDGEWFELEPIRDAITDLIASAPAMKASA